MVQIDHLDALPKSNRPLDARAGASDEDRKFHWELGKEYFDGTRAQGLGGYYYDGRWKPVARRLADYYGLGPNSSVLDVGCAKGFLLHDFLEEVPGIMIAGIDISGYALSEATDLTKPSIYMGNAKQLPFPDDAFDFVISINSLHNILDRAEVADALREIERVSRAHKYIKVGAYRNAQEKSRLGNWAVVATTYLHCDDWLSLFEESGYTGDYDWFNP